MTKESIIQIWKSAGWNNIDDYYKACTEKALIIDKFNPDEIDPKTFWSAADEHFYTDPVANSSLNGKLLDIKYSNTFNHRLAKFTGMLGQMDLAKENAINKFGKASIAEIGCGYGSFFDNYITENEDSIFIHYTGFDVVKRFKKAVQIEGKDGTFTKNQTKRYKNKFNIFYSANVFQHLSPTQIKKYLIQIYDMLPLGGYANIMYVHGVNQTYHYGQSIEIIPEQEFGNLTQEIGYQTIASTKVNLGDVKPFSVLLEK